MQLDLLPRVTILQTSPDERGQIYVPAVNAFMFVAVTGFVLVFRSSDALIGGLRRGRDRHDGDHDAARRGRRAHVVGMAGVARSSLSFGVFLFVDLAFIAGNATKIPSGGWVPLLLAAIMFMGFETWRDGRARLRRALQRRAVPWTELPKLLAGATKVPGTAVFLVSHSGFVPTALLRNLEHNHVYHEHIVILNLEVLRSPRHDRASRAWVEELMPNVHAVRARFGFMETPDVSEALRGARQRGLRVVESDCTFFLGWHLVRALPRPGFAGWRAHVFAYLQRRGAQAAEFFRMPTRRVVVLATEIEI